MPRLGYMKQGGKWVGVYEYPDSSKNAGDVYFKKVKSPSLKKKLSSLRKKNKLGYTIPASKSIKSRRKKSSGLLGSLNDELNKWKR